MPPLPEATRQNLQQVSSTMRAMSGGYSISFRHWSASVRSLASGVSHSACWRSVMIQPGMMQLTRILSGPRSRAKLRVRPSMPALAVV
jgi:hypothetical protein